MRIAMVSMTASPLTAHAADGAGRSIQLEALSRALAARGHEVVVHTRRDRVGLPCQVRLGPGVTVHHVDAGPLRPLVDDDVAACMPRFASELAQRWLIEPPHVAHAHVWDSGVVSTQAASVARVPVALTFHTLAALEAGGPMRDAGVSSPRLDVERSLARSIGQVIAASRAEVRELLLMGASPDRLAVVPEGVDTTLFSPRGPEFPRASRRHRLLSLGALTPDGGADDAIRLIAQVPMAELVVAGGPATEREGDPDVARLRLLAKELEVADRVTFVGAVPQADRPGLIRSADIVVWLPGYELSARVALEAMACGRPIVATGVGALLDVVDDGVTGLLVEPQSPSAAAMAVRRLLGAPGMRDTMSEEARIRAEGTLDWEHVSEAAEQVYRAMRAQSHGASLPLARLPMALASPSSVEEHEGSATSAGRSRSSAVDGRR